MILVNAANGQQGKLLVPKLISAGQVVRACVRSERSAAELLTAGATDVVVGDLADPDLIARAVSGVEKVYHVCPGIHPREREIGFAWIDAAKAAGVRHFVFSSVLHPLITELVQHEIKRDIEEHLIGSGLEFTILQPTIYMAPRRFGPAIHAGVLKAGWSLDREQSLVDIGDVTDVAAEVLMNSPHHATATYQLVGTGRYTAHDMGAAMAKVIGRDVKVEQVDSTTYFKGLFGDRDPRTIPHEISVSKSLTQRCSDVRRPPSNNSSPRRPLS
jgi:uncharacterized protein YbjT (DUF2867 family)